MSKTLNEMVRAIVDYCGSITRAADEIGVHYNTLDRLLKDETATAQAGTMEKIEAIYEEIAWEEEPEEEEPEEKIEKLEVGKTYEIRIPKNKNGNVATLLRETVKGEYRRFYHLDDNGTNVTVLKADLVNDRTFVREIDGPTEGPEEEIIEEEVAKEPVLSGYELYEMLEAKKKAKKKAKKEVIEEEPVDVEYVPVVDEEDETTKMIEELTEEPFEEEESTPTIIGTTPAERLHSCLFIVELCDQKIAEAEKAKRDKAAILPLMDKIYEEFRA